MKKKYISTLLLAVTATAVMAQGGRISGRVYDAMGPIMMCNVVEKDANNRIVSAATTDINGNFSMVIKNKNNKLSISYVGYKTQTMRIGERSSFNIKLDDQTQIKEVVVKSQRKYRSGGLAIPKREVSVATQTMDMSDVEGLSFTSVDEAMQGKIAGLDIVANSGNLGSGTSMRLRGVTTISGSAEPLIVVDDNIMEVPESELSSIDLTSANEETYASLLSVNPSDIESIDILKDAAATAIWGSRGSNGVISIRTKRGARGKARVDYRFSLQSTWQPKGYSLLNGDDYTMLMKEELYNPSQSATATTNINELNYNRSWSEYENWNNNTDWVKAIQQVGWNQSHFLTISGGGEKASFRMSAGYDHQNGTIIKQVLDRFSTKLALDYWVSDRIKFSTTFPLTYTKNQKNYDGGLLGKALKLAPNMSIYRQDANGNDTNEFHIMMPSGNSMQSGYSSDQLESVRSLGNPVASASLATNVETTYRIQPEFKIDYDLLGNNDDKTRLRYTGSVYLDVFSKSVPTFAPGSLSTNGWTDGSYNKSAVDDYNSLSFTTRHQLTFTPKFKDEDWYLTMMLRGEMTSGTSNGQHVETLKMPNGTQSPTIDADLSSMSTSNGEWRSMSGVYTAHLSFQSKYMLDFSLRADGSTKFGGSNKWGYFPGISGRWNVSDERFMKWSRQWLSMLAFRPSWGIVGNQPRSEYLQYSKYATSGVYGPSGDNMSVTYVDGMQLTDLKWERTMSYNLGGNIGFFDDRLTADFNYYYKKTSNLLMQNVRIPASSGFTTLAWKNVGALENRGWELNIDANRLVKFGKFAISANMNISQNFNKILEMDESVLESINKEWSAGDRGTYLNRIQVGNPVGSIYGYRYKGVYQYSYDWLINYKKNNNLTTEQFTDFINNEFLASGKTAPIATNAEGKVKMNADGTPVHQVYNFSNGTQTYVFDGGDAIYEDINHDGQINSLDIVYLGNSNPKVSGGFGVTLYYGNWSLKTSFNYRVGYKIVNNARMSLEKMFDATNQSLAVNYRWRKNGDVTIIPRALYNAGYNFQGSDRFVEDGSFLRMSYIQLNYSFPKKNLKKLGLNQLTFYISAQNLFVWTKYSGTDPEHPGSGWNFATDSSQTPRSKSVTFSLNIGI